MSEPANFCIAGGHLIGADEWMPAYGPDYDWGASYPRIGCSHVVCSQCGCAVRELVGRELVDTTVEPRAIFALAAGAAHRALVDSATGRVYACVCHVRTQFGVDALDPDPAESSRPLALPWRCGSHSPLALPGVLDGLVLSPTIDFDALAVATLALRQPVQRPWATFVNERRHPAFWLARLYALASAPPYRVELGDAAARALDHDDAWVRRGAINFFRFHPLARGGARLAHVLETARERFDGVADPDSTRRDLGYYLREAIELRLALRDAAGAPVDPGAHTVAHAELLAGRGTAGFVLAVGDADPAWLVDHAAAIVGARADLLAIVLRAFRTQPTAVAVSAVSAIARAGVATPDALRTELAALSEPNRAAMLAAVDAGGTP